MAQRCFSGGGAFGVCSYGTCPHAHMRMCVLQQADQSGVWSVRDASTGAVMSATNIRVYEKEGNIYHATLMRAEGLADATTMCGALRLSKWSKDAGQMCFRRDQVLLGTTEAERDSRQTKEPWCAISFTQKGALSKKSQQRCIAELVWFGLNGQVPEKADLSNLLEGGRIFFYIIAKRCVVRLMCIITHR